MINHTYFQVKCDPYLPPHPLSVNFNGLSKKMRNLAHFRTFGGEIEPKKKLPEHTCMILSVYFPGKSETHT